MPPWVRTRIRGNAAKNTRIRAHARSFLICGARPRGTKLTTPVTKVMGGPMYGEVAQPEVTPRSNRPECPLPEQLAACVRRPRRAVAQALRLGLPWRGKFAAH